MYLKVITFLFFLFIIKFSNAQSIQGIINDKDKNPIANASILLKNSINSNEIIQYSFSDFQGNYSIKLKSPLDSLIIEINSLSFEPKIIVVNNIKNKTSPIIINVELQDRVTKLKEVVLNAVKKPIKVKKDTVVYRPDKFKDGTEKVVEDLLKKLPGIEIESNGLIRYKGKPISKLLLEGDDLFGMNYTIGSKNIDVDIVNEVEAIDNYIDNPLLRKIKDSDEVAINLKLKKGKSDFSGNTSLGYGYQDRYDLRNTVLGITKKVKGFVTLQYNNIGENYTPYNFLSNKLSIESISEIDFKSDKLINEGVFKRIEGNSNTRINNTLYTSLNNIFKVSEKTSLKVSLGYYNDKLSQITNNEIEYNELSENLVVKEFTDLTKKPRLFNLRTIFKSDISDDLRINIDSKISTQNNNTFSYAINNTTNIENNINTKVFFTKHDFLITKRLNQNNAVQLKTLLSYSSSPQSYQITPGFNFENGSIVDEVTNKQESSFSKSYADGQIKWFNKNLLGKLNINTGFNYTNNRFISNLLARTNSTSFIPANDMLNNNFVYSSFRGYLNSNFLYTHKKWSFKPTININYLKSNLEKKVSNDNTELNKFYINPALKVSFKTGKFSGLYAFYGYNKDEPDETRLFNNFVLTSFRSLNRNSLDLNLLNSHNFNLGYLKNDFYNLFRLSTSLSYSINKNNYSQNTIINQNLLYNTTFLLNQRNENYNINFFISKYLSFLRTTFSLRSNYFINLFNNRINNSDLRLNKSETLSNAIFLRTGFKKKINIENKFTLFNNSYSSEGSLINTSSYFEDNLKIIYEPSDKLIFTINNNYTSPTPASKSYYFLDTELIFTPNEKVIYSLIGKNLTNNKNIETFYISDFSRSVESYNLIGFYLMMSANFKF